MRTFSTDDVRDEMRLARGHVLLVHLWATWCAPCLQELPALDRMARRARAQGAVFLSLSLDSDYRSIARVTTVLRARAPSLTPAVAHFDDGDRFISLFSKSWEGNIPALFVFDRTGKLERSFIGQVDGGELDALVARLSARAPHVRTPTP